MSDDLILYHNPRCSKSRAALDLLQARGLAPRIVRYLETPPTAAELERLLGRLGLDDPRALMRRGEAEYAELALTAPERTRAELLEAMAAHPRLIERPILVRGERAVVARPPERVAELLD
ncbi:arsenate reductase (glutaredoxin) [Coralloluteibacterium thermophilus]|uniref:Arsenate reductase n=1 Tax=Coralloluteibacterium thermophilum TaxID=2707049 RepID=A0ABV9NNU8_9GAMM